MNLSTSEGGPPETDFPAVAVMGVVGAFEGVDGVGTRDNEGTVGGVAPFGVVLLLVAAAAGEVGVNGLARNPGDAGDWVERG